MSVDGAKARSIFTAAVENHEPHQWGKFLDDACGVDIALRKRVELLLKAHQGEDSFLDRGREDAEDATINQPAAGKPGAQIGPYKLLQQIGEGGMGVVFMAEQKEPVKRRVALKIVKPGMDTQQVVARFEAERQALAMMDHPNIARVIDVGTTQTGRPYFVMELVKGVPITTYCDEHRLTPRERLDLIVPICQAVQHAHHKGIIHRDIKPSNVLVAEYDDRAVPKIIDFGVAKALNQTLTEKTMFTEYGQVIGTIEYMSPEQAKFNQMDVDTRTDIYSLGVLLYELLTGTTPFEKQRLRSAAFDEVMRIIREEDPPRPSARLSTVDKLPSVAAMRQSEPKKLRLLVRGELDWIVMKAMDKDRARRYESAIGLADDIRRYLGNEPVAACPPSAAYRFRKFARRHKTVIAAGALVAAALLFGILGTTWQAIRATDQRDRAREAEAEAKAETARRESAEASRRRAEQAEERAHRESQLAEAARVAEAQARRMAEAERARAEQAFHDAQDARDAAVASERKARANEAQAVHQRQLADRQRQFAERAKEEALSARLVAVRTAARTRETEEVIAQLVQTLFSDTQAPLDVQQNLHRRYELHWAMAAFAHLANNEEERIANLKECVDIATECVRPLEERMEQNGPYGPGELSALFADLSTARSRQLRAKRQLAALAGEGTTKAALEQDVLNHLAWWRQVDTYFHTGRRGGEGNKEANARCKLFLAAAEAVAGGVDLDGIATDGRLPADFSASRSDEGRLLELAVAAGEHACEVNQFMWSGDGDQRLAFLPEIVDGLTVLLQSRIALAQFNRDEAGHKMALESHAAALKQYIEDIQPRNGATPERAAISFLLSHHALTELQLARLNQTNP